MGIMLTLNQFVVECGRVVFPGNVWLLLNLLLVDMFPFSFLIRQYPLDFINNAHITP